MVITSGPHASQSATRLDSDLRWGQPISIQQKLIHAIGRTHVRFEHLCSLLLNSATVLTNVVTCRLLQIWFEVLYRVLLCHMFCASETLDFSESLNYILSCLIRPLPASLAVAYFISGFSTLLYA